MKTIVSNSFSLNMLAAGYGSDNMAIRELRTDKERAELAAKLKEYDLQASFSGEPLRRIAEEAMGRSLRNDINHVELNENDGMVVFQYNGPRLSDDSTTIPKGGKLRIFVMGL